MADNLGVSLLPASAGNKLDIQWGVGREILLADVGSTETEESAFGSAQWQACTQDSINDFHKFTVLSKPFCRDEPSSSQRQVAYDTMKLYRAIHTQALQGEHMHSRCHGLTPQYYMRTLSHYRSRQSNTPTEHPQIQSRDYFCLANSM